MTERSIEQEINKNLNFDVKNHSVKIYIEHWIKDDAIIFSDLPPVVKEGILKIVKGYSKENPLYISRQDIFNESNILLRFIKTLMFGYPKAEVSHFDKKGIQSSMHKILCVYPVIETSLKNLYNKNFSSFEDFLESPDIDSLCKINGMGLSTLSKILYLFNVKVNNISCIIIDSRVKNSLKFFNETKYLYDEYGRAGTSKLKDYLMIIEGLSKISNKYNINIDLLEYILFNQKIHS